MKKNFSVIALFLMMFLICAFKFEKIFVTEYSQGLYVVKIKPDDMIIKPYVSENLITNYRIFRQIKPILSVNAGFFDTKNGKTTSYVIIDKKIVADPSLNQNLTDNEMFFKNLDKIYDRAEFRVLDCNGKQKFDITFHNEKPCDNCIIKHSIQAGPMLLPEMDLEKEYFIDYENDKLIRDPLNFEKQVARTAIGLKNKDIYLIIASNSNPLTIKELQNFVTELKLEKAMCFDGGGSTSFNYKNYHIISDKNNTARKVKSFLLIK